MRRFWFAVVLAFALWPSVAVAGASSSAARLQGQRVRVAQYAHQVVRSPSGLELLRGMGAPAPSGCPGGCPRGCAHRTPSGTGNGHQLIGDAGSFEPAGPVRVTERMQGTDPQPSPVCERLTYHATAPPSLR